MDEDTEFFLNFVVDEDTPREITQRVSNTLEQFTYDEIITANEIDEEEILQYLYGEGFIGLPEVLDYGNNSEEVPDLQDEDVIDPEWDD